jgi:hypothetical protein
MVFENSLRVVGHLDYPEEIQNTLIKILDLIISDKITSVILSGSASRGEMSYISDHGRLNVYSDLELFVITRNDIQTRKIKDLTKKIKALEDALCQGNKFFHLDVSFLKQRHIKNLPPKFQFSETRKTGIVLYGRDLRCLFPLQVDFKHLNESSLNRLWSIILHFPNKFTPDEFSPQDERDFRYILARSGLDIVTWLLPYTGHLIYGFKDRIDFIQKNYKDLEFIEFLPTWFLDFLRDCWRGKMKFQFKDDLILLYDKVLACYTGGAEYILYKLKIDDQKENVELRIMKNSPFIFHEHLARRKAFELMLLARNLGYINMAEGWKWLVNNKKGIIVAFLFNLNYALLNYLKKEDNSGYYLKKAEDYLFKLDFRIKKIKSDNFPEKWLYLRQKYIDFLVFFYRWFAIKKEYLNRVISY